MSNNGVELYHSNSLKLGTYSGGLNLTGKLNVTGDIDIPDNSKLLIGTGDDLQIFHDGSDSKITNKTGNLFIEAKDSETGIKVIPDGSVELYHDNVRRVETKNYGMQIHGALVTTSDVKVGSYVGKLIVGTSNEFTIQHDDTDTFIENNRW